jgi:hypothetical protein
MQPAAGSNAWHAPDALHWASGVLQKKPPGQGLLLLQVPPPLPELPAPEALAPEFPVPEVLEPALLPEPVAPEPLPGSPLPGPPLPLVPEPPPLELPVPASSRTTEKSPELQALASTSHGRIVKVPKR